MTDTSSLGERELDVMTVLWELGSGTVNEVLEALDAGLAYTTVLTILRNLENKDFVTRKEEGRGHRYFPRVHERVAQRDALSRMMDAFFHGSPAELVAELVESDQMSAAELKKLAAALNQARDKREGK